MEALKRPSKKQRELLSFIDSFIKGHGYGPSYREVMRALDYKSVSTVAAHIDNLIKKGHLQKKTNSARSLEVVKDAAVSPRTISGKSTGGQWLIDKVEARFDSYDNKPTKKKLDELYVLVGALHILKLKPAAEEYTKRLESVTNK